MKEGGTGILLPGAVEDHVSVSQEGTLKIGKQLCNFVTFYVCNVPTLAGSVQSTRGRRIL